MNWAWGWLAAAMILVIIEILSPLFGCILIAGAAVISAGLAAAGFSVLWQILAFGAASVVGLGLLRPRIIARLGPSPGVPSRTEALVGKSGRITEPVDPVTGSGRAVVDGQDWAVQSDGPLAEGTSVRVLSADGIKLKVEPAKKN